MYWKIAKRENPKLDRISEHSDFCSRYFLMAHHITVTANVQ
jgi:hypothetical protein